MKVLFFLFIIITATFAGCFKINYETTKDHFRSKVEKLLDEIEGKDMLPLTEPQEKEDDEGSWWLW